MLVSVIFAAAVTVLLLGAILYLYTKSKTVTTIPGLDPLDTRRGTIPDIGSLHEFLADHHAKYGSIVSFWWGNKMAVSIASPQLFREHQAVFDRPYELSAVLEPMLGKQSIQFTNGMEGRNRRKLYDKAFSHSSSFYFIELFNQIVVEQVDKLRAVNPDDHTSLQQLCMGLMLKGITRSSFGDYFNDEKALLTFKDNYDVCWQELAYRQVNGFPKEGTPRDISFQNARQYMMSTIGDIITLRREHPPSPERQLFIDVLLENDLPESQIKCDAITYLIGGFHNTGNLLTWCLFNIATHPHVQEKVYKEISNVLSANEFDILHMPKLVYLRQVIDETLRVKIIANFSARYQDVDCILGGHVIPKGTTVIHALGVALHDKNEWPNPEKFDPDRFSPENSKHRDKFAFQPFGFAGKRICPGYRLTYLEATVYLAVLCRTFKFTVVEGQEVEPKYEGVTSPNEEIYITLEKRLI